MGWSLCALAIGFGMDLILGDPQGWPHPVIAIGKLISLLERVLRRLFPATPRGENWAGAVLWVLTAGISAAVPALLLWGCHLVSPWLRLAAESVMCWQILAVKSLRTESMKVHAALSAGDTEGARRAVSMIVGRDTARLDRAGIARAAVETVAENTSDGVIAPMLFLALGGPVLGFFYKSVNTLDSMVGYKNEKYLYFGRFSAKLDDVLNWIPARISGILMVLASPFSGLSMGQAFRIYRRDRRNHASPNSAHTEAAAAGALGVRLAGNAWYFGKLYEKPSIGDALRPVEHEDIRRVNRLMYVTAVLALAVCALARWLAVGLWG